MTASEFISTYGYLAVLLATLLQGQLVLLLAGLAAQQGHLSLSLVLPTGFVGATVGSQLCFWVGRRWGPSLLRRLPWLAAGALRVAALLSRRDAPLVLGVRFLYGLRIAGPVAMGALGVAAGRFAIFNALGAAVWVLVFGGLGYLAGGSVETVLRKVEGHEAWLLWAAVAAALLVFAVRLGLRALRRRGSATRERHP